MMTPQLDPKLFLASKPAVGPVSSAVQTGMKSASPLNIGPVSNKDMPPPQPKAASPNPLASAFATFAKGFAPQQTAAVDERYKADGMERNKKALTWLQQTAQLPAEQRAAFTLSRAQDIARDTGQSYEAVVASARDPNGFSDDSIKQGIAAFSAQLGIAPTVAEPMSAYEAEQIRLKEAELAQAGDDKLTTEVGGNGNFWSFNTASGKMEDTGVKAPASRVSGDAGASGVQSVHVDQGTGRATAVMRDGSTKDLGFQPVQTQVVDVGGVPTLVSKIPGTQNQPLSTSTEVGTNQGAIEGFKALGKVQADAIKVLPEAISTSERVIQSIDELLNAPGFKGAYGVNRFLPQNMVPGSDAKNADAIRGKLDGQFFVNAVTAMQVSLAPVSDADALRLVASISQLTNPDISDAEALRVGNELKDYFRKAKAKAEAAAKRGPMKTDLSNVPVTPPSQSFINRQMQGVQSALAPNTPKSAADLGDDELKAMLGLD